MRDRGLPLTAVVAVGVAACGAGAGAAALVMRRRGASNRALPIAGPVGAEPFPAVAGGSAHEEAVAWIPVQSAAPWLSTEELVDDPSAAAPA